eukprot:TRINITY_DN8604_c0_g1_i1.p1 TRINITY_DN8604_c0_g1~~TRINITY_DN8604_c0_g1_i1.p1  ORF type:complete len:247 (+),score=20.55 TRINITY_DN8604_c0_g1_i1:94-741(+)
MRASVLLVVLFVGAALANIPYHWNMYKQCDSTWANQRIGTSTQTICQVGCAMSCVAMSLSSFGERIPKTNATITPGTLNIWLTQNHGYEGGDELIWDSIHTIGRMHMIAATTTLTREQIVGYINRRMPVVANVRHGHHWVLLTGYSTTNTTAYNVNDPGFNQEIYTRADMGRFIVYTFSTSEPVNPKFSSLSEKAHSLKEAALAGEVLQQPLSVQ